MINQLNVQYKTVFSVLNVVYVRYRIFPLGNYTRVTLKNDSVVGNLHLINSAQPESVEIPNWHAVPIE